MEKKNVCKKCNKPIPEGYKYDECEHCRGEKAGLAKKIMKGVVVGAGAVLSLVLLIVTNGKHDGKN